jgi:hypothetical protein
MCSLYRTAKSPKSGCEQLALDIPERLEFQSIPRGIQKEHRGLLAGLTLKANVGFDQESNSRTPDFVCKFLPSIHGQDDSIVWNGNLMAIHQILGEFPGLLCGKPTVQMDDDLVTKDIKVDPMLIASALREAEGSAIKFPGLMNVPYRDRHMEGSQQSNTFEGLPATKN